MSVAGVEEGWYKRTMTPDELRATLTWPEPPGELSAPLAALWWDAKGDWARAHGMVDDLETDRKSVV